MKMPSKGTPVYLEGLGAPLFVKGPDMDAEEPDVCVKYEGPGLHEGYGRGIVSLPLEVFEEKRVYSEQLPKGVSTDEICERTESVEEIRENYGT